MTKIIAFAGRKGSGKDTAAGMLRDYHNVKFAGALKAMFATLLAYRGADDETILQMTEGYLKEQPSSLLDGRSPRYFMQMLGTEFGRDLISNDFWVNSFWDQASQYDRVVVTDCRFQNEVDFIRSKGGKVARITRLQLEGGDHVSETNIDNLDVDFEINNSGSIEYLELQVREFVENV